MNKSDEHWKRLVEYRGHAPRELVVAYTKAVVEEAKRLPMTQLATRGSAHSMSQGEIVASKLITGLAQQEWLDVETEPDLEDILSIAGQLDMQVDDQELWQELFEKVHRL